MTDLRPSRGGQYVKFIESFCVHGEGDLEGQPARLRDDQRELIWRWCEHDDDGVWWHERLYYEAPKGDGKTMLFAWFIIADLFLHHLNFGSRANIIVSANSRLQAGQGVGDEIGEGIFGRLVQVLTNENCELSDMVTVYEDRIVLADGTKSRVRLFPARASTVDGGLPTLFVADEVQDWGGQAAEAHQRNENSTTKRAGGRSMSCSTPGARAGDPTVGWRLHEYGTKIQSGVVDDPRFLFILHAASAGWDLDKPGELRKAIIEANPGITKPRVERLVRRYAEIPRGDFCRFHLAQWQEQSDSSWLADRPGAWARCVDSDLVIEPGTPIYGGVDVSLRNDSTAVVYAAWIDERWVVRSRVFVPGPDGVIDQQEVKQHVRELSALYDMRGCSYDPRFFEIAAQELLDEGIPMEEEPQSPQRMIPKCGHAWDMIVGGVVAHDGDPVLAYHVNGAAKRFGEGGWTLSKAKSNQTIDACIAMVLALHLGVTMMNEKPAEVWMFTR